jgi:hypothetical protein
MEIDNYKEASDLNDRLMETLPFRVKAGKALLATIRNNGEQISTETEFSVGSVSYSGDIGGIQCALDPLDGNPDTGERYIVSITHLKIDPMHPLIEELQAYQERRTRRLKLQEQKGFVSELLATTESPKRKSSKGFGK